MKHKHLEASKETYISHLFWAIMAGFKLIGAGFASILHGIHPGFFPFTAAKTVVDLYYGRLHNHPNEEYQKYIKIKREEHEG